MHSHLYKESWCAEEASVLTWFVYLQRRFLTASGRFHISASYLSRLDARQVHKPFQVDFIVAFVVQDVFIVRMEQEVRPGALQSFDVIAHWKSEGEPFRLARNFTWTLLPSPLRRALDREICCCNRRRFKGFKQKQKMYQSHSLLFFLHVWNCKNGCDGREHLAGQNLWQPGLPHSHELCRSELQAGSSGVQEAPTPN